MDNLTSAERGNHTLLQLLKLLEANKIGMIGGFDWKSVLRELKETGLQTLDAERHLITRTLSDISKAVKELQGQSLDKKQLKIKVAEVVSEIVEEKMGTSVTDFYVRKAILIDGAYDEEDISVFLQHGLQSDVRVLHGFLKNRSVRRGINIAPGYFDDDYDDFIDPIYLFLLLDFITDGILDLDFVGECIGADESFLSSDKYGLDPELEPVGADELTQTESYQETPSYQESTPSYEEPTQQSSYEAPVTNSYGDDGGDSGGDDGGCD